MELGNGNHNELLTMDDKNKYYDKNYHLDENSSNDSHVMITKRIKNNSKVLDIGCGSGLIGEFLHNNKHCEMYGIELDKEAYKVALKSNNYKEVYNFSITDENSSEYINFINEKNKFDYIILADLLEHLINPAQTLNNVSKWLKKDGIIYISLPNVGHFDIMYGLADNRFNYQTKGLLDNTHIRFFTDKSFAEMVKSMNKIYKSGFDMKCVDKTIVYPEYIKNDYLFNLLQQNEDGCVLQYIMELRFSNSETELNKIIKKQKNNIFSQMEEAIEERDKYISNIENSKSWKLTSCLRKFSGLLKR